MPSMTEKIIQNHLREGVIIRGEPIAIRIDQTLTQDATGTMAYLQLEAMGVDQVKTDLSVSYVDHNTLQSGFENADDHKYLQTVAARHGVLFSRAGNGICQPFIHYALPLIQGEPERPLEGSLPKFAKLKKVLTTDRD